MEGAVGIELTPRQLEIIEIVKKHAPITGEQIADLLGVSKPALRSDLAILVTVGFVRSKPKVGYFPGEASEPNPAALQRLKGYKVKDLQGKPISIKGSTTVHDAVIMLFSENIGTLVVTDEFDHLEGIVSRKDLLKVTLGNPSSAGMPIHLVMTRHPNIVTISPDESVIEAARKMIHHQVDSLPVVKSSPPEAGKSKQIVVGRITKTHMTKVLLEMALEG
ncbi:helix-turn-helix transcriptional regulator [Paenibacillus turpanensis]|uniref:helix-turn-helix transcriptional regulator n=1 Tax=Paenibacillus turpanensis TaxID=2689078 RepID=UPI00140A97A3|nr:helix-turn-helix transcriptional regulator [Paenibacillus turpanensis]